MELGLLAGAIALAFGVAALLRVLGGPSRRERQAWKKAAARLGLSFLPGGLLRSDRIVGEMTGLWVTIDTCTVEREHASSLWPPVLEWLTSDKSYSGRPERGVGTRIVVDGRGRIPPSLSIARESFLDSIGKAIGGQDIPTGDPVFDSTMRLRGEEMKAIPLLDERNRRRLLADFSESAAPVANGAVRWMTGGRIEDPSFLATRVRTVVEFAQTLCLDPREIPARLARNALEERLMAVRVANLRLLEKHFTGSRPLVDVSRALLTDTNPEIRLVAARQLGAEGLEVVSSIASTDGTEPVLRIEALRHLVGSAPREAAGRLLERLLTSASLEVQRAAIELVGKLRHRPALDRLVALLREADPGTAIVAAEAIGRIGDPAAEPALLDLLESDRGEPLRTAVAQALGAVGTRAAVEQLLAFAKRGLFAGDLEKACRGAIASIQARLGEVDRGRLSLAEPTPGEGALSLATGGGEVSFPGQALARPEKNRSEE